MQTNLSYIIKGCNGQDWQGANWVFYNMCKYLIPFLEAKEGAEILAQRLEEAIDKGIGYMDISDIVSNNS